MNVNYIWSEGLKTSFKKKNLCRFDCKTKNFKMAARVLRTLKKKGKYKNALGMEAFLDFAILTAIFMQASLRV